MGMLFFVLGCVIPVMQAINSRGWRETPCTITSSELEISSDSDGTSYAPKIKYRYSLDGGEFNGDRYSFFKLSAGRKWAQSIVDRYPVGTTVKCFYDPQQPSQAVLDRSMGIYPIVVGGFTMLFVIVGLGVIFFGFRTPQTSATSSASSGSALSVSWSFQTSSSSTAGADEWARFDGPQKLKPVQSRWAAAIGVGLITLFWDGIVSVFVVVLFFGGQFNWCFMAFLVPFILIGLLLIVASVHQALALFNPKVEVALSNGAIPLGQSMDVAWQLTGRTNRLKKLTVKVIGTEKVTYTRGTRTHSEDSNFFESVLFEESNPAEFEFGTREFQVPESSMHSFRGNKNQVLWKIVIHGDIPYWPNMDDSFEFYVKPKGLA